MLLKRGSLKKKILVQLFKAFAASTLAISMILFPQQTFQAAFRGLDAWWSIVFPALLPFFVMSELLIGLGVVNFIGVLLEPVMRPLFNVPGAGAFVVAMGYTSGAPIGTILSTELRKKNLCTHREAQRLMSFTSNTSPLFLFGAVSVGMFHDVSLGITLALGHYLANILIGLFLGLWSRHESCMPGKKTFRRGNLVLRAFQALIEYQNSDKRPLGTLMADAVKKSAQTLSMIGGYIIFFSVLTEILNILGLLNLLAGILMFLLSPLGLDPAIGTAVATGFFEITLGTKLCSEVSTSLSVQLVAASAILGWGGLSIHAQVASIIKDTDIKMHTFIFSRCAHAILAPTMTLFLIGPASPVFANFTEIYHPISAGYPHIIGSFFINGLTAILAMVIIFTVVSIFAACFYLLKRLFTIGISRR